MGQITNISKYKLQNMEKFQLKNGGYATERHESKIKPGLRALLPEALAKIEANGRGFFTEEVDMGRIIGNTICVTTDSSDEIVYARRIDVSRLTRFVKKRLAVPSSFITVILKKDNRDHTHFVIIDAFIGNKARPEPFDLRSIRTDEERQDSIKFWSNHALIWGSMATVKGSETRICPWSEIKPSDLPDKSFGMLQE
jgi:hypothetical protein